MLSHTIDVTQRGDESTVCGRLSNYVSSSRVPRHARLRRQIEEAEAAANPAEEQKSEEQKSEEQKSEEHKSEEGTSDLTKEAEQEPADDTEKGSQSSAENSENTSKHVPDTDEAKEGEQEDHKSDTTPEQHVELVNEAAKYVTLMYVCPCIVVYA